MSKARKQAVGEQFDMFLPYIADLSFRDQREMMERPFFSLAKSKRIKPIDYTSPDGKLWVNVAPNPVYGMATIWDADILIYCASVLADMARRGLNDVPRTLHIMPYDLLRAIGRPTTGRAYELLGQALDRLVATTIKTNIRADAGTEPVAGRGRREATFSWLDGWTQLVDERTERSKGMTLELSNWFYEGVLMKGGVLAIDRAYFDISGGRERWLYKVARKHAGGAGEAGFAISMPTLFEKSGAEGEYRRFKFEILKLAEKDALPGYDLVIEQASDGEPMLRMRRNDAKAGDLAVAEEAGQARGARPDTARPNTAQPDTVEGDTGEGRAQRGAAVLETTAATAAAAAGDVSSRKPVIAASPRGAEKVPAPAPAELALAEPAPAELFDARSLIRSTVAGLTDAATRGYLAGETLDLLRRECPGWDFYALHAEFERWVAASPDRTPANWQKAFIGWARRHHEKHRHTLRG